MKTTLITGDCLKVFRRRLALEKFDVAITSPPYNIGIEYGKHNDKMPVDFYIKWIFAVGMEINKHLTPEGSFFLNIAGTPSAPDLPFRTVLILENIFRLQNTFHWIKAISIGDKSVGHFKPINSQRYVTNLHEYVFHFSKYGSAKLDRLALGVPYADKSNVTRWKHTGGRDRRCRGNVWYIPYETIQTGRKHPSPFPVALAEHCIKISGARSVIDPFVGCGTTGVAAYNCKCASFVGIDIDSQYIKEARKIIK